MAFPKFIATPLLLAVLASVSSAQGYVVILPEEISGPYFARTKMITEELKAEPENTWAGAYLRFPGETWSEGLNWSPQGGFAAFRDTCSSGPRAWVNYGRAEFHGGVLELMPDREKDEEFVLNLAPYRFTPVKWGEQHWLVPADELKLFAYIVNSRSEDDVSRFGFVKVDDLQKNRIGQPELPNEYRRFLRMAPINAKVIAISEKAEREIYPRLTLNAGSDKGVIEGMSFWLIGQKNLFIQVQVIQVTATAATVSAVRLGSSGERDIDDMPKLGWRFTSRYHEPRIGID